MSEDYDEIEQLIDGDPIKLGRLYRQTRQLLGVAHRAIKDVQAERDEARKEIGRLGEVNDRLYRSVQLQRAQIAELTKEKGT